MSSQINSISTLTSKNELASETVYSKKLRKSATKKSANMTPKSFNDVKTSTDDIAKISDIAKSLATAEYVNLTKDDASNDSKPVVSKTDNSKEKADCNADENINTNLDVFYCEETENRNDNYENSEQKESENISKDVLNLGLLGVTANNSYDKYNPQILWII